VTQNRYSVEAVADSRSTPVPTPAQYLTAEQARRVYDRIGRAQDLQALYEHKATAVLLAHGDFDHANAVLELGHGTGALAQRLLTSHLAADAHYTGIDLSPRMHQLAANRIRGDSRAELRLSDGSLHLPFPDASFDRFLAAYVLDLLSPTDITLVLAEAHRLLAPNGLLCLASLTAGATRPARVIAHAWRALWARRPALVGGCRPIRLTDYLDPARWSPRHHEVVTSLAISTEILVTPKHTT
jgi:ubiquinone/menaquinone biosynthesis C-methylase UbiE